MAAGGLFLTNPASIYMMFRDSQRFPSENICIVEQVGELKPEYIGLGLFHHNDVFGDMPVLKLRALVYTIQDAHITIWDLIQLVQGLLQPIKDCYKGSRRYSTRDDQLAENFALDACFILQFFSPGAANIGIDDSMRRKMIKDIFMPGNQIPLFLLVRIMRSYLDFNRVADDFVHGLTVFLTSGSLSPLVLSRENEADINYFLKADIRKLVTDRCWLASGSHHLLHLLHKSIAYILQVPDNHTPAGMTCPIKCEFVLGNLEKYNITFKARNGKILFTKRFLPASSVLHLPKIRINEDTLPLYRGLMAFDWKTRQCNLICDLTFLMCCIVQESNECLFKRARIIHGKKFRTHLEKLGEDFSKYYGAESYHGGVYRTQIDELDEHSEFFLNEWIYKARSWRFVLAFLGVVVPVFFGVVNEMRK